MAFVIVKRINTGDGALAAGMDAGCLSACGRDDLGIRLGVRDVWHPELHVRSLALALPTPALCP